MENVVEMVLDSTEGGIVRRTVCDVLGWYALEKDASLGCAQTLVLESGTDGAARMG